MYPIKNKDYTDSQFIRMDGQFGDATFLRRYAVDIAADATYGAPHKRYLAGVEKYGDNLWLVGGWSSE